MDSAVMVTALHIEFDALCLLALRVIAYQSAHNVSQQMRRVLFRNLVYGILLAVALDIARIPVQGRAFPGGILLNRVFSALLLALGVVMGCVWYLYVLEALDCKLTRRLSLVVMSPGAVGLALSLISIRTGWVFRVGPDNVYARGPLFRLHAAIALGMLLLALGHILLCLAVGHGRVPRPTALKLLGFCAVPVAGAALTLPFTGMPGIWPCASIALVLLYMDDQDREILRDSLTGLNNRKTLNGTFVDYARQVGSGQSLYLFMMDLDNFKHINDTYGHPMGDQALIATAKVLTEAIAGTRGIIARFGGDEFLVMGFMNGDDGAEAFRQKIAERFEACNREGRLPFPLAASVGYARYIPGQDFEAFLQAADSRLYAEKNHRKHGASRR